MINVIKQSNPIRDRYLKRLYKLQRHTGREAVPMGDLAQALAVTPGTATTMMKRLAADGLVTYQPYAGVRLTVDGRRQALHLVRRHRLLECFLIDVLAYEWSDVHATAEQLELGVSNELLERIDAHLGNPTADPHGNPIPTADGELATDDAIPLTDCEIDDRLLFIRIGNLSPEFLDLLAQHGWRPGSQGVMSGNDPVAETATITAEHGRPLTMSRSAAKELFVEVI